MRPLRVSTAVLVVYIVVTGCRVSDSLWPGFRASGQQLGEIAGYNSDDPRITIEQAGNRVDVSVTSYGGGCHSMGETRVAVHGVEADIAPFDSLLGPPGGPCTSQLREFVHRASMVFQGSGVAVIRVWGIDARHRSATNMVGDTIMVERTVVLP